MKPLKTPVPDRHHLAAGPDFPLLAWEADPRPAPSGRFVDDPSKVLPLMVPLFGILRGNRYTYQWSTMLILLYLTGRRDPHQRRAAGNLLALAEAALSVIFFMAAMLYAAPRRPPGLAQAPHRDARNQPAGQTCGFTCSMLPCSLLSALR